MRILSVLAFRRLVSYGIRRGATTGGRSAAARGAEGDGAPRAPGVGGMGGVGFKSVWGGVRVREPPPTRRKPKRETEEGGGLCAAAPEGQSRSNNRTRPIMRAL